jgi:hypothetical protein
VIHFNKAVEAKIDALFAPCNRPGTPGFAVGILHRGEFLYRKGFGQANLEHPSPISEHTVFDVGSMAKMFTGMAITLLEPFLGHGLRADELTEYVGAYTCRELGTTFTVDVVQGGLRLRNRNRHFCSMDLVYQPTIQDSFVAYDPHPVVSQITFLRENGQIRAFVYRDYDGDKREDLPFIRHDPIRYPTREDSSPAK